MCEETLSRETHFVRELLAAEKAVAEFVPDPTRSCGGNWVTMLGLRTSLIEAEDAFADFCGEIGGVVECAGVEYSRHPCGGLDRRTRLEVLVEWQPERR